MSAAKGYLQEDFSVSYESLATEYEVTQKPESVISHFVKNRLPWLHGITQLFSS
jgi:hypothetical protein